MLFVLPLFVVVYTAMALNEEGFLTRTFGDRYRDYMVAVPRFVPDFRGVSKSVEGMSYDWRRALRKDYGQIALVAWITVLLAMRRCWEIWPESGRMGGVSVLLILIAYVAVRRLKLTGRLEDPAD